MFDAIVECVDKTKAKECRSAMLGKKIGLARKSVRTASLLSAYPQLKARFIQFCSDIEKILHERNNPLHSTFIVDDESEDVFHKWSNRNGPELIRVEDLNHSAEKFRACATNCLGFLLEMRDFKRSGMISGRTIQAYDLPPLRRESRANRHCRGPVGTRRSGRAVDRCQNGGSESRRGRNAQLSQLHCPRIRKSQRVLER